MKSFSELFRQGVIIPCPKEYFASQFIEHRYSILSMMGYLDEIASGKVQLQTNELQFEKGFETKTTGIE